MELLCNPAGSCGVWPRVSGLLQTLGSLGPSGRGDRWQEDKWGMTVLVDLQLLFLSCLLHALCQSWSYHCDMVYRAVTALALAWGIQWVAGAIITCLKSEPEQCSHSVLWVGARAAAVCSGSELKLLPQPLLPPPPPHAPGQSQSWILQVASWFGSGLVYTVWCVLTIIFWWIAANFQQSNYDFTSPI